MHATGKYSISVLAELFSVSRPTVYRTLNRRLSLSVRSCPLPESTRFWPFSARIRRVSGNAPGGLLCGDFRHPAFRSIRLAGAWRWSPAGFWPGGTCRTCHGMSGPLLLVLRSVGCPSSCARATEAASRLSGAGLSGLRKRALWRPAGKFGRLGWRSVPGGSGDAITASSGRPRGSWVLGDDRPWSSGASTGSPR